MFEDATRGDDCPNTITTTTIRSEHRITVARHGVNGPLARGWWHGAGVTPLHEPDTRKRRIRRYCQYWTQCIASTKTQGAVHTIAYRRTSDCQRGGANSKTHIGTAIDAAIAAIYALQVTALRIQTCLPCSKRCTISAIGRVSNPGGRITYGKTSRRRSCRVCSMSAPHSWQRDS